MNDEKLLKSCPFCGNDVKIYKIDTDYGLYHGIKCHTKDCYIFEAEDACHDSQDALVRRWNTRSTPLRPLDEEAIWTVVNEVEYAVEDYEWRGDSGDYTPTENEQILMRDYLEGYLDEFVKSLAKKIGRPAGMKKLQLEEFLYPYIAGYAVSLNVEGGWSDEKQSDLEKLNTEIASALHQRLGGK